MKKLNRKGFTIVELVIVIAVIAILAAVLIPTMSNLIKTAQTSADVTLVKNVNLILATERATEGKNATMQEALDDAFDGGYDITKLTPTNSANLILWDQESDNFVLYANGKYNNVGADVDVNNIVPSKLWEISETTEGATHSIYYIGDKTTVNVNGVGFDAGTSSVETVNYASDGNPQDVIIRTNGGKLVINASEDSVDHYGVANVVDVQAIADASYYEFGKVLNTVFVKKGHVVITEASEVGYVVVTDNGVLLDVKNDTPFYALDSVNSVTINDKNGAVAEIEKITESDITEGSRYLPLDINSVDDLVITADSTKDTSSASAYVLKIESGYYVLESDIELIHSNDAKSFSKYVIGEAGSEIHIDLNGHTIDMTNISIYACDGTKVYLSNGKINSALISSKGEGPLFVDNKGELYLNNIDVIEATADYVVSTNGLSVAGSVFEAKNSSFIINAISGVHYAASLKADADFTFINCTLSAKTGGVTMKGGDLYVDGCTIISSDAYGANYDTSEATLSYCQNKQTPGFGDGILISDRNSGYTLNSVTVKNTKFIHEGDNVIGAFGLRVVDCAADGDDTQAIITLENLSFSDNLSGRTVTVCGEYSEENWITSEYECKWIISAE